ncbi:insulin-like growth factor [Largemouth bass virus]|uniref:Insulin-like growth factor n=1 Tax=Mandarin fish ranavirus TaxID=2487147 RepID=A0ACD6B929_9VIRU|nr:putative insulin-like growth factor [Mandarin fish ranavirus]WEI29016.1 insulin-like growth factor [Largemouth bass virus]WHA35583.1 putative insulin-like growth factor [Micropterus salmoides ranavirus]WHA35688.1 putative insulin-like growth factor [Siniperca chuatsi ranavirus]
MSLKTFVLLTALVSVVLTDKLCGKDLVDALLLVCGEKGVYSPKMGYARAKTVKGNGIADVCCTSANGCDLNFLEKFCKT